MSLLVLMLLELEIELEPMLLFVLVHHEPEVIGSAFELICLNPALTLLLNLFVLV